MKDNVFKMFVYYQRIRWFVFWFTYATSPPRKATGPPPIKRILRWQESNSDILAACVGNCVVCISIKPPNAGPWPTRCAGDRNMVFHRTRCRDNVGIWCTTTAAHWARPKSVSRYRDRSHTQSEVCLRCWFGWVDRPYDDTRRRRKRKNKERKKTIN